MAEIRRYPAGVQDFEEIRKGGFVYVDKTRYIYDLANTQGNAVFLSRPRRFGKSLLCSTLKYYFQGRRDLFEGLAIDRLESEWTQYPVLHFSMSSVKDKDPEMVRNGVNELLRRYETTYGCASSAQAFGVRLGNIIRRAHEVTGQKVVVIIDEYDSPVLNVIDDKDKMAAVRNIFNSFYPPLKDEAEHLRFVFLTGITKFSQMSIFSTINHLTNISMERRWEGICGITAQELVDNFQPDVEQLARDNSMTADAMWAALRDMYDGYHFSRGLTDIYNPFSLLNAFRSGELLDKWFDSATPSSLISTLRHYPFDLSNLDNISVYSSAFDQPFDDFDTALPILYQSGYLTIKDCTQGRTPIYTLGIPNREVHNGLYDTLLTHYVGRNTLSNQSLLIHVAEAMRRDDINAAMTAVQNYLAALPYDANSGRRNEIDYERDLRIIFECIGIEVDTEVKNATGRCDVVMKTANKIYVLELKIDDTATVDDALAQIDEKNYLIPYWNDPRPVVKVGAVLDRATRTIREWRVVE